MKFKYITIIASLILLVGCQSEENVNPIIGIWETTLLINNGDDKTTFFNSPSPVWIELKLDGTYSGGGGKLQSDEGVYFVSSDTLFLESRSFVNKEAWLFKLNDGKMECSGTKKYQMENLKMSRKRVSSVPE